jgi:integration host factor subunit alpha
MAGKTLTRLDLAEVVSQECGLHKPESAQLVGDVLEAIMDAMVEDGAVKIAGFATFTVRSKEARVGRNPKTGVEEAISARNVVGFRASHHMKDKVKDGNKG